MLPLRRAPISATDVGVVTSVRPSTYPFKVTNAITGIVTPSMRPAMVTQNGYLVTNRRASRAPVEAHRQRGS